MPIKIDSIRKEYGDVVAVDNVSLGLGDGQFHCILGANGCGKTTLFRLILGLTKPTAGTVSVSGGAIGCGFQRPNFYPDLTVRENLTVFASLVGNSNRQWRETLLDELRLRRALDRTAGDLSGGFARKLDLALAMLKKPQYLLLDEPLGALDDVSVERFLPFLASYAREGHTVLVSTHNVTDFEPFLDRVSVMYDGNVVFDRLREDFDLGSFDSLQEFYVDMVVEREGVATLDGDVP